MSRIIPLWFAVVLVLPAAAIADGLLVSANGQNQIEFSLSTSAERDSTVPREILEEWFDLDLRVNNILAGIRYEAFQPHELSTDSTRQGITQRFGQVELGKSGIRAGNFYGIFGRGLLFRSYEDRTIRIDGNMDGLYLWGEAFGVQGQAFTGKMRNIDTDLREAILRGVDVERRLPGGFTAGASFLNQSSKSPNDFGYAIPPQPRHEEAFGGRASYSHDMFDLYVDLNKINRYHPGNKGDGSGYYAALSGYPLSNVSFTLEYKEYDKFRFAPVSSPFTEYNSAPSLSRESGYTLVTRHPHQLDMDDEKGFQFEVVAAPIEGSTLILNRTETARMEDDLLRSDGLFFEEWYGEWRQTVGDHWEVAAVYDYLEEAENSTENHTPVLDVTYDSDGLWSIRGELQLQNSDATISLPGGTAEVLTEKAIFGLLEWNVNYNVTLSLVAEHDDFERSGGIDVESGGLIVVEESDNSIYGDVTWRIDESNTLSLFAGQRREGFVCVGGVCRFEPAFEGIEVKLLSSF